MWQIVAEHLSTKFDTMVLSLVHRLCMAQSTIHSATRLNLHRLMMIRLVIIISFTIVILGLMKAKLPFQYVPMLLSLAALGVMNVIAWVHTKTKPYTHSSTLFIQLVGDITALSCLFYFSGGYSNPFIWMYLLPITVSAVALKPLYTWVIAGLSTACYSLLMFYNVPLSHLHAHAGGVVANSHDIHLVGMWLGFVVSAIIVAIFITRIGKNLRDYDQQIAEAREKALEGERLLALGTQAASAAHELGTPLATMHLTNQELIEDHAENQPLVASLNTMQKQIMRCKEILSSMTSEAGLARAEDINHTPLKTFLSSALARWQDTRPAVELITTIDANDYNPDIVLDSTLTRAILNVLDNAADASNLRVEFNAQWDNKQLVITVKDYGEGITNDTAAKLGTPFFTSKKQSGTGLGVYLTQLTLARYDGELSINNHPDGGAMTVITLPLKPLLFNT